MIKLNKILVCEFITGGGLCAEPLPESLAKEGVAMRDALLRDLSSLPYEIVTTIDARLTPPEHCLCQKVRADDDVWQIWQTQMELADAVFLIAPETDGVLHYLTQMATLQHKLVLGCGLDSILTTSDKMSTYLALKLAGVKTINTFSAAYWAQHEALYEQNTWVAKPNDGAGCEAVMCFDNAENLMHWFAQNKKQNAYIVQPFQAGTPASISCVMQQGKAQVLSCNKQIIELENHTLSFKGVTINGMREQLPAFKTLANQIAAAFPSLAGYVGIDVLVCEDKVHENQVIVVEINPRLTTSYAGLRNAIGQNPAELIINTLTQPDFKWPKLQQNVVTIRV
jgi:tyramine---L-glutamate ligase